MKKNKHKFNRLLIALTAALLVATTYAHAGQTTRVSSAVAQGNSYSWRPLISADGRYVAFNSNADNLVAGDTNGYDDVYVRDRLTGKITCISFNSGGSGEPRQRYWLDQRRRTLRYFYFVCRQSGRR